jgi:1-deoxy-D-xylulose-5-phosphate synthase
MGIPDKFIEHGSVKELLEEIGMTVEDAFERIGKLARKKQKRA